MKKKMSALTCFLSMIVISCGRMDLRPQQGESKDTNGSYGAISRPAKVRISTQSSDRNGRNDYVRWNYSVVSQGANSTILNVKTQGLDGSDFFYQSPSSKLNVSSYTGSGSDSFILEVYSGTVLDIQMTATDVKRHVPGNSFSKSFLVVVDGTFNHPITDSQIRNAKMTVKSD